jgi:hypothetical protein
MFRPTGLAKTFCAQISSDVVAKATQESPVSASMAIYSWS